MLKRKKKLTDIGFLLWFFKDFGYGFGFSDVGLTGFLDTGWLITYQSTSASKVDGWVLSNNRKTTLFFSYGFYLAARRVTNMCKAELYLQPLK